jgi:hypothetical protein
VRRINHGVSGSLSVYWHVAKSGEVNFYWSINQKVGSISWISAYSGVDIASPIDAEAGQSINAPGASVSTPSITTSQANEMLVASYLAMSGGTTTNTLTAPAGMTQRANIGTVSYSTSTDDAIEAAAGASGAKTATASWSMAWALSHLLALRPAKQ